jgi:hypothetical protein
VFLGVDWPFHGVIAGVVGILAALGSFFSGWAALKIARQKGREDAKSNSNRDT